MTHDEIIAYADEHDLSVQCTAQGETINDQWPVLLITGPVPAPASVDHELFGEPDREARPVDGQIVYGYNDDHAISVLVDQADTTDDASNWLHVMLYDDAETFERGWALQGGASPAE